MQIVIVRSCQTSRGFIDVQVPGGTKDAGPIEVSEYEGRALIALGHARVPPPAPSPSPIAELKQEDDPPAEPAPAPLSEPSNQETDQ